MTLTYINPDTNLPPTPVPGAVWRIPNKVKLARQRKDSWGDIYSDHGYRIELIKPRRWFKAKVLDYEGIRLPDNLYSYHLVENARQLTPAEIQRSAKRIYERQVQQQKHQLLDREHAQSLTGTFPPKRIPDEA